LSRQNVIHQRGFKPLALTRKDSRFGPRGRLVLVACSLLSLAGCQAKGGVAVSGSEGEVTIHLARCDESEKIFDVQLIKSGKTVDDDLTVWRVKSEAGVGADSVLVGGAPPGFTEVVPLAGRLEADSTYVVKLETQVTDTQSFRPSELEVGKVLYVRDHLTLKEFKEEATSGGKCAKPLSAEAQNRRVLALVSVLVLVIVAFVAVLVFVIRRQKSA
jgi:hypothetical protein